MIVIALLAIPFLLLAQHPFVTYPLTLLPWAVLRPARAMLTATPAKAPSLSVLCCCHNEQASIDEKVKNLLAASDAYASSVQLLFHLDACSDRTEAILRQYGERVEIIVSPSHVGKSVGMSRLRQFATGDILVFTDANTFIAPDAFTVVARTLQDQMVGGVSGRLSYLNRSASVTAWINHIYWQLEERIKLLESKIASMSGSDGAFFAIRRDLYHPAPPDIIDDMHTSMQVVLSGLRFVSIPAIHVYEKTSTERHDEFRRKIRITCRCFNLYRLIAPKLHAGGLTLNYMFYSHRVLRWLSPMLSAIGVGLLLIAISIREPVFAGFVAVSAALVLACGRAKVPPFTVFYEAVLALTAVGLGVVSSLQGKRYQVWSAAPSGR